MSDPRPRYWFKAHRYGYGWGTPGTWQGWLVLLAVAASVLLATQLPAGVAWVPCLAGAGAGLLVWACVTHGEPARWRWGRNKP